MVVQKTSMSEARANFADALESATNGEVVVIERRGKPDTALVDAELLEDFLAYANPRLIKKIQQARVENTSIPIEEAFAGLL